MSYPPQSLLSILQAHYTTALAQNHHALAKLYTKLASLERRLTTTPILQQTPLPRKAKKKLQWSRSIARAAITRLEAQHLYLRACADSITVERYKAGNSGLWNPLPPRPPPPPPSPEYWWGLEEGYSRVAPNPWCLTATMVAPGVAPQYWDLAMLGESSSPPPSEDFEYCQPALLSASIGGHDSSQTAAGDDCRPRLHGDYTAAPISPLDGDNDDDDDDEEEEEEEEEEITEGIMSSTHPPTAVSPTSIVLDRPVAHHVRVEAEVPAVGHRRVYSENAIQITDGRLPASRKRRTSLGPRVGCGWRDEGLTR